MKEITLDEFGEVPASPHAFLEKLGEPTAIHVPGLDNSKRRGLVAMLHGNEPSGLVAVHDWLRAGRTPACDAVLVVAAVEAALVDPGFAHRMLDGRRDLNRCFAGPFDDKDGRLAADILRVVRTPACEAIVDLHNNTGKNRAYGVISSSAAPVLDLVSAFANVAVYTQLRLGTLLETMTDEVPITSIECGQSRDPHADQVAIAGIQTYLESRSLTGLSDGIPMTLYRDPVRVCVAPKLFVAIGEEADASADITLRRDLDTVNFQEVPPGTLLGWARPDGAWPLVATSEDGRELSRDLFELQGDRIVAKHAMIPIMMTADPVIIRQDCVCYLVKPS